MKQAAKSDLISAEQVRLKDGTTALIVLSRAMASVVALIKTKIKLNPDEWTDCPSPYPNEDDSVFVPVVLSKTIFCGKIVCNSICLAPPAEILSEFFQKMSIATDLSTKTEGSNS